MATVQQTFEEAVEESYQGCNALLEQEAHENFPPPRPAPYPQGGPPVSTALRFDADTIRTYAYTIGDDNPLYTDPEYAKTGPYGTIIAPSPMLSIVRYPT